MSSYLAAVLALLLGGASLAPGVHGQDWPQWRGPDRTGHVPRGTRVPTALPAELRVLWRLEVGQGLASPVVAAGRVFYFDNQAGKETLHAIQAADSREVWRAVIDDALKDEQGPAGPRCTPVVDGDLVFAQSGMGELQCLSVSDGRRLWHVNFTNDFGAAFLGEDTVVPGAAEHGYTGAPVIADQSLIACAGGTNGAGVVCFDKRSGKILWRSQNDRAAYAAPIVSTLAGVRQVVCFTVEGLVGLALDDGALLWRIPVKTPYGRNCTTPAVLGDWLLVGSYRAGLIGVKVSAEGAGLKAERAWVNKDLAMNFSSPVIIGRHLFGLGPGRKLVCVEVETGRLAWAKEGYLATSSEVAYASFLVMGDNLLVLTDGGVLALIASDAGACRELGRAQVCGPNWCNPAYVDGRLYLRDGLKTTGSLYCLELMR